MILMFKIRSSDTGLYSKGGASIYTSSFSKKGKCWKKLADVKRHLGQLRQSDMEVYKRLNCVIEEYHIVETLVSINSINDMLASIELSKQQEEIALKIRREKWEQQIRLAQYEKLKKEFE